MVNYTKSQKTAINHLDGNLQIIACAGSGKTQVISQRIVNILKEKYVEGVKPENIVAFTFTKKAASELKDRIHRLCKEQLGHDRGLAEMYVGTIHGFCLDLLQTYEHRFLKYTELSEVQQRLLIDRNSKGSGLTDLTIHDNKQLKRWTDSRLYQKLLSIIREGQINKTALNSHPILRSLDKYEKLLHKKRYLDYSMLLTEAVQCLKSDQVLRQKISARICYLVVDEYQDVNPLQEELIKLLHELGAQICVVGDDDQTIYQWNGSDINNILGFSDRYPDVTPVTMGENFRSSSGIVETARQVAERNLSRLGKQMISQDKQVFEHGDLLAIGFSSPQEEAKWIVEKIRTLHGLPFVENGEVRGLTWSDCAILLRSVKNSAEPIVEALRAADIRYVIKGMNRLFETEEVRAARSIFYYLNNEINSGDLKQIWLTADLGIQQIDLDHAVSWLDVERAEWSKRWRISERSLQHTYLGFLEKLVLREESIPDDKDLDRRRGEIIYYNLGKFSQLITDYEQIHFQSKATSMYGEFSKFLRFQAPDYYPEGAEDIGYARPDAIQITTVHQAKGMEFPAVFVPNLVKNRFPTKKIGGRQWHHVIPIDAVVGAERYLGTDEDERRLFYVALTRSKKNLFCTWAPEDNRLYKRESPYIREFVAGGKALTSDPMRQLPERIEPRLAKESQEIGLTFSELKYFFECPYQFKLRFLYGFNPGINERIGYGKSLHDALAEVHRRALDHEYLGKEAIPSLLENHFHLPFAWGKLNKDMRAKADKVLQRYFAENSNILDKIEHAEKSIELKLAEGVVVHGRIDLIRRTDTREIIIIDFKSTDRAQDDDVTHDQLHLYALGYQQLTGESADLIEIYKLDEGVGASVRELVDNNLLAAIESKVVVAGRQIREGNLDRVNGCSGCDFKKICRN